MIANTLLNRYLEALKMSDSSPIDFGQVILDILKYLDYKESGGDADPNATVDYEKMWSDIMKEAESDEHGLTATVDTYTLRKILEKYNILEKSPY